MLSNKLTSKAMLLLVFISKLALATKFHPSGEKPKDFNRICKKTFSDMRIVPEVIEESTPVNKDDLFLASYSYKFPGIQFPYNPSIATIGSPSEESTSSSGTFLMSFRFDCTSKTDAYIQGYAATFELDSDLFPASKAAKSNLPSFNDPSRWTHEAEDVRLLNIGNRIHALFNDTIDGVDTNWISRRQHLVELAKKGNGEWQPKNRIVRFDRPDPPIGPGPEKNWVPFLNESSQLLFQYTLNPFRVLTFDSQLNERRETQTSYLTMCRSQIPWDSEKWGHILRGGTPAVFDVESSKYLSFFHSVQEQDNETFYHLGAYTFDNQYYCIQDISPEPITWEGMYDEPKGFWASQMNGNIIFPSGLVETKYRGNSAYLLSVGVNDSAAKIMVVDKRKLASHLVNANDYFISKLKKSPKEDILADKLVSSYLEKNRVYVSLTTSPSRLDHIQNVLDTLDLDYVKNIFLVLPERYGRKKEKYNIPVDFLRNGFPKVRILRPKKDLGPLSKLHPAAKFLLDSGESPESIIISVDDDTAYPAGMIGQIIKKLVHNEKLSVGSSTQPTSFWHFEDTSIWSDGGDSVVVEGFGGVGHRLGNLDLDLMEEIVTRSRYCLVSDDIVVNFSLDKSGISRERIDNRFFTLSQTRQFPWGFGPDALHKGGGVDESAADDLNADKYQKCNQHLLETYSSN